MNRYPPPRPLSVLWHACRPLVSTRQKLLRYRSLQSPNDPSSRRSPVRLGHQGGRTYKLQRIHQLNEHARTHSKYIGFPAGGFLQVAVSEATSQSVCELELLRAGAPDTALGLVVTKTVILE